MRIWLSALAGGTAALLAIPAIGFAATIPVFPGDSIQAAVNRAKPGDEIAVHQGTYPGSVEIRTSGLKLKSTEFDPRIGPRIKPGKADRCHGGEDGICILPHRVGDHRVATKDTKVKGFKVRGFDGSGVVAIGAKSTTIVRNNLAKDGEYGAVAFGSVDTNFQHNVARGNDVAGFYVGDSPHAGAVLHRNKAIGNGEFGFFLRDSAHGLALDNEVTHNCLGIGLVNTGASGGTRKWRVRGNEVSHNTELCEGDGEDPPTTGTGIAAIGARGSVIRNNKVYGNRPVDQSAPFAGGIVVSSSTPFGGGDSAHNLIKANRALGNEPADIRWDGRGADNLFVANTCKTSQPNGLCGGSGGAPPRARCRGRAWAAPRGGPRPSR
jgi:Right handed beta helix region